MIETKLSIDRGISRCPDFCLSYFDPLIISELAEVVLDCQFNDEANESKGKKNDFKRKTKFFN